MNHQSTPPEDSWENDAVWKLLDQSPVMKASPRFADDVVRSAKLYLPEKPWWARIFSPIPLAGLATATAALALAFVSWTGPQSELDSQVALRETPHTIAIQDAVETEMLIVAVDHLDDFSDQELVSLIGF